MGMTQEEALWEYYYEETEAQLSADIDGHLSQLEITISSTRDQQLVAKLTEARNSYDEARCQLIDALYEAELAVLRRNATCSSCG